MLSRFSESDSRIRDDPLASDAGFFQCIQSVRQETSHVPHDVVVVGVGLHGLWCSQNVHADHAAVGLRADVDDFRFESQAGNVVDDVRSGGECLPGHFGLCRVDRDQPVGLLSDLRDDIHDSAKFFGDRDPFSVGPRRLAADVEDVRPVFGEFQGMIDRRISFQEAEP